MHAFSRRVLAILLIAGAMDACCPWFGINCPPQSTVSWDVDKPRTVKYRFSLTTGFGASPTSTTSDVVLEFRGNGVVAVSVDGDDRGVFRMDPTGALQPTRSGQLAPPETDLLAAFAQGQPVSSGASWSTLEPADSEVAAHQDAVVIQSRRDVTVRAVSAQSVSLDTTGYFRIPDTPGLRDAANKRFGAAAAALLTRTSTLQKWRLFLTASTEFDRSAGRVATVKGVRNAFGSSSQGPQDIAQDPSRDEIALEVQP